MNAAWRSVGVLALLLFGWIPRSAEAQTPNPLQEWQYSGGVILARLFEPDLPEWRTVVGVAANLDPIYDGARDYRVQGGPVFNIQYRDVAFFSTGDGLGYNFIRGSHHQFGISLAYDLGRRQSEDLTNLHGMGDIGAAPVPKLYGQWVVSKSFPAVLRVDARQFIGGAQGATGDVGIYMPIPGSTRKFVMFLGPSATFATAHYMQVEYGVSEAQSMASGHPEYDIRHAGMTAVGAGLSATRFFGEHWLVNLDAAYRQIHGQPAHSPIVENRNQKVLALSLNYDW